MAADTTIEEQVAIEHGRLRALDQARRTTLSATGDNVEDASQIIKEEPIGWVTSFCLLLVSMVGDAAEIITAGTVGWFVGLACDGILLITLGLTASGKKQFRRMLVAVFGEKIPAINIFPLRTIFMVWAIVKSRSTTFERVSHLAKL